MSTETVMLFWFIHLFAGIVIPALIYCDGCQAIEEAKPNVTLWREEASTQQLATELGSSHAETNAIKKGES